MGGQMDLQERREMRDEVGVRERRDEERRRDFQVEPTRKVFLTDDDPPNVLACAMGARSRRNTFEVGSPKLAMLLAKRLAKAIPIRWPARPARFTSQNPCFPGRSLRLAGITNLHFRETP
jgi:hypothetical protein